MPVPPESVNNLSLSERRALLEDIARIGLALGRELTDASGLPVSPTPGGPAEAVAPLERLRLLAALWPPIQAALGGIARHPDGRTRRAPVSLPMPRSRGGPKVAGAVAHSPEIAAAWRVANRDSRHRRDVSSSASPSVPDLLPENTADTRANRLAVTLLDAIGREAAALAVLARLCGEAGESARAGRVAEAARIWRTTTFLRDLTPLAARERADLPGGENTLRSAPAYRALVSHWRRLYAVPRFDWTGHPLVDLPALEAWHLYEIWCFLKVAAALRDEGWRLMGGDALRWEANGLCLALVKGRASRLRFLPPDVYTSKRRGGREKPALSRRETVEYPPGRSRSPETPASDPAAQEVLELFYQPLFLSANQQARATARARSDAEPAAFASRSHAMQPDSALLWRGRLYLLDPKFRAYSLPGEEQDDVNKMHAYRDAIIRLDAPRASRAVAAAWCLFPGEPSSCPALPEAVRAYPASTPERPFGAAGIGAIRLRPGDAAAPSPLALLLHHWFHA
jgi:hypothetical protein